MCVVQSNLTVTVYYIGVYHTPEKSKIYANPSFSNIVCSLNDPWTIPPPLKRTPFWWVLIGWHHFDECWLADIILMSADWLTRHIISCQWLRFTTGSIKHRQHVTPSHLRRLIEAVIIAISGTFGLGLLGWFMTQTWGTLQQVASANRLIPNCTIFITFFTRNIYKSAFLVCINYLNV